MSVAGIGHHDPLFPTTLCLVTVVFFPNLAARPSRIVYFPLKSSAVTRCSRFPFLSTWPKNSARLFLILHVIVISSLAVL